MLVQEGRTGCAHDRGSVEDLAVAEVIESDEFSTSACRHDLLGVDGLEPSLAGALRIGR